MIDILILVAGFLLATIASEIVLKGARLQTGLGKVLLVHILTGMTVLFYLMRMRGIGPIAITTFWAGALLSWFGIRSHIESSILLRLVYFLRERSMTDTELLIQYDSYYGEAMRLEELFRARLMEYRPEGITVTRRGKFIIGVVSRLK